MVESEVVVHEVDDPVSPSTLKENSHFYDRFFHFKSKTHSNGNSKDSSASSSRNNSSSEENSDDEQYASGGKKSISSSLDGVYGTIEGAASDHSDLLEGYLKKHGALSWKQKYFVLKKDSLEIIYFRKRRHYLEKRKPLGTIDLQGAAAKKNCAERSIDHKEHVFIIFYPNEAHGDIIYLQAFHEAQSATWVNSINELSK